MTMTDREPGSQLPLNEQLRFDAGSPALNLLATKGQRRSEHPVERMPNPERLRDWLAGTGLPVVPVTDADLDAAREVREAAYRILSRGLYAASAADDQRAADAGTLSAWSSRPLPGPRLSPVRDGFALEDPPATFQTVLTRLARDLVTLAADGDDRLRGCDGPECAMLYLDTSRGRRRRWCSMARCGNTAKVGRFRESAGGSR